MSREIAMQGFILAAIIAAAIVAAVKCTIVLDSTQNIDKVHEVRNTLTPISHLALSRCDKKTPI